MTLSPLAPRSNLISRTACLFAAVAYIAVGCGSTTAGSGDDVEGVDATDQDAQVVDSLENDTVSGEGIKGDTIGFDVNEIASQDSFKSDADILQVDVPSGCTQDSDCTLPSPCLTGTCTAGKCGFAPNTASCDDGNACTGDDKCANGLCAGTSVIDCDDGNICTKDSCDLKGGCKHAFADGLPCDDGQKCSAQDVCGAGKCLGVVPNCNDGKPCTDDTCLDASGCVNLASAATCDDGNACTDGDACKLGQCAPGSVTDCNDGIACTIDSCDLKLGCTHVQSDSVCTDGNACTTGDTCVVGLCLGVTADCDDKNPCTDDSCNTKTGCLHAANDSTCSDDNPCTAGDACNSGSCVPGTAPGCDDGNTCTKDSCDISLGCTFAVIDGQCSDGNACTLGDTCQAGVCKPAVAVQCDDGNPCTIDACDLAQGCTYTDNNGIACDDGQACSTVDTCTGGKCLGNVANCDDANPCTDDTCLDASGCVNLASAATCDDGNACTTNDTCNHGNCGAGAALTCDDKNPCTQDSCDLTTGCTSTVLTGACSDGDACTASDTCIEGTCQGSKVDCNDGNICTADSCDPQNGCQHNGIESACSDNNACTSGDWCVEGQCAPGETVGCDDNNDCSNDVCDPLLGCTHTAAESECSDGNACTTGDACVGMVCMPAGNLQCSDNNPCTNDSCAFDVACVHSNADGAPCDDGQKCSVQDACLSGECLGIVNSCDDNNPCTDDTCSDASGCVHTNNTAECSDGNLCTTSDVCGDGACKGVAQVCNDNNPCTAEGCDPVTGCFSQPANDGLICTDNSLCTTNDVCVSGTCAPGAAANCDDTNMCTDDGCEPATGCTHTPGLGECLSFGVGLDSTQLTQTPLDGVGSGVLQMFSCPAGSVAIGFSGRVGGWWDQVSLNCAPLGTNGQLGAMSVVGPLGTSSGGSAVSPSVCPNGTILAEVKVRTLDLGGTTYITALGGACLSPAEVGAKKPAAQGTALTTIAGGFAGTQQPTLDCPDGSVVTGLVGVGYVGDATHRIGFQCTPFTQVCVEHASVPCEDGNACTTGDTCNGSACVGGAAPNCDDGNACTADSCNSATGCVYTVTSGADCNDGNGCSTGETCSALGVCGGGLVCATCNNNVCDYLPTGVQINIPESTVTAAWTQCYSDTYDNNSTPIAAITAACTQGKLMLACRPVGSPTLSVLAWAPRDDVLFDTGSVENGTHAANGVNWYFNDSWSWGFAPAGGDVSRSACDVQDSSFTDGDRPTGPYRLCWHTRDGNIDGGWRCGASDGLGGPADPFPFGNPFQQFQRIVYQTN